MHDVYESVVLNDVGNDINQVQRFVLILCHLTASENLKKVLVKITNPCVAVNPRSPMSRSNYKSL